MEPQSSPRANRRLLVTLGVVVGLVGAAACSSAHSKSTSSISSTSPTSAATPTSAGACHPTLASGTHAVSVVQGSRTRTAIVHIPPGSDGRARPLVVDMHGSGSTAAQQEVFSGMDATADADGFVAAYPQAAIPAGAGFDWNIPGVPLIGGAPVPAGAADDVAYIKALVAQLHSSACIDLARVYATGFSGGARLSSQLACDASTTFAAVAPVSGLRLPTPCPTTRAVPVIAFHGTADPVDPYNGNGQPYWTYSVPVAAQRWAAHNGCGASPRTSEPAAGVTLAVYSGCRDGSAVELYTIAGEGHEWPGGPKLPPALTRPLGPQSTAVDADDLMWAFFRAHPMP